jgi:hypothetical protein
MGYYGWRGSDITAFGKITGLGSQMARIKRGWHRRGPIEGEADKLLTPYDLISVKARHDGKMYS